MASKRLNFPGNHQTTYADWAKSVLQSWPNSIRFAVGDDGRIEAYYGNDVIAEFHFSTGTGWTTENSDPEPIEERDIPQFMEFDVDTLRYP